MDCLLFNTDLAARFGVNEAIMLENFKFWIIKNKADNKNIHEGKAWTYNSKKYYAVLYHFWTYEQVKRILASLKKQEVLITGNYNKHTYDRTLWYSFSDTYYTEFTIVGNATMDSGKSNNAKVETQQPIPVITTNKKTDKINMDSPSENQLKTFPKIKADSGNKLNKGKIKETKTIVKPKSNYTVNELYKDFVDSSEDYTIDQLIEEFSETEYNPKRVSDYWRKCMTVCYKDKLKTVPTVIGVEKKMLDTLMVTIEEDKYKTLGILIGKWYEFTQHCENGFAAFNSPVTPMIPYLLKFKMAIPSFSVTEETIATNKNYGKKFDWEEDDE